MTPCHATAVSRQRLLTYARSDLRELEMPAQKNLPHGAIFRHSCVHMPTGHLAAVLAWPQQAGCSAVKLKHAKVQLLEARSNSVVQTRKQVPEDLSLLSAASIYIPCTIHCRYIRWRAVAIAL